VKQWIRGLDYDECRKKAVELLDEAGHARR
jgi:hypothetical protein